MRYAALLLLALCSCTPYNDSEVHPLTASDCHMLAPHTDLDEDGAQFELLTERFRQVDYIPTPLGYGIWVGTEGNRPNTHIGYALAEDDEIWDHPDCLG